MSEDRSYFGARRPFTLILCLTTVLLGVALLVFSGPASDAIANALEVCVSVLIPALFPFMVFSVFVVKSGLSETLSRFLEPVTRALFKLPGCTAATILAGFLGGYPAAARGINALLEEGRILPSQAERMVHFCICAGPAFAISAVGTRMLGSVHTGLLLYAAQLISALAIGILEARFVPYKPQEKNAAASRQAPPPLSGALIQSVEEGVQGMLMMCAAVCLCGVLSALLAGAEITGAFTALLDRVGLSGISQAVPDILLEVTDGCRSAVRIGGNPILLCSLALSWGGFCIHLQIFSSLRTLNLNKGRFYLFRVLQTLLSALAAVLLSRLFPSVDTAVFSTFRQTPKISPGQHGVWACLALIVMSIVFLSSLSQDSWIFPEKHGMMKRKRMVKGGESDEI